MVVGELWGNGMQILTGADGLKSQKDLGTPQFLYPDSNFFRRLTRGSNEYPYVEFINECELYGINLSKGWDPIFSPFLLLESIGLGGILKPLQKSSVYKSLVQTIQLHVKNLPLPSTLDDVDLRVCQEKSARILDDMGSAFLGLLNLLSELEIESFVNRIDEDLATYANSVSAEKFIDLTLKRLGASFKTDPLESMSILKGHLVWNLIVTFPYIEPDQISREDSTNMFQRVELWFNALFAAYHKSFLKGRNIGFFRLAENRAYTYSKIVAKDQDNPQFAEANKWLVRYKRLRREDDLCDGELIDFATLGLEGQKVFCFTSDDSSDIKERLALLKQTLEDASRDVENWAIKPCWGRIYCTSKAGIPLKIIHSFLLDQ